MELLVLTVPALLGGDVSDAGCLVIFWGMACVVEKNGTYSVHYNYTYMSISAKWASFIAL